MVTITGTARTRGLVVPGDPGHRRGAESLLPSEDHVLVDLLDPSKCPFGRIGPRALRYSLVAPTWMGDPPLFIQ